MINNQFSIANGTFWALGGSFSSGISQFRFGASNIRVTANPNSNNFIGGAYYNNFFYVFGGNNGATVADCYKYDLYNNIWSTIASLPAARAQLSVAAALNGKIYAMGGEDSVGTTVNTVYEYDPVGNSWVTKTATMPANIEESQAAIDPNTGIIYISGGFDGGLGAGTAALYSYMPDTDTWSTLASMPISGTASCASAILNGYLYTMGGAFGGSRLNSVCEYNIATNTWKRKKNMLALKQAHTAVSARNRIYTFGGDNGGTGSTDVYYYNQENDTWFKDTPNLAVATNLPTSAYAPYPRV